MASSDVVVSGEIKFAQDPPKGPLEKPSLLVVKLQDCRRAGASAINIAHVEVDAHQVYVEGQPLMYSMKVPNFAWGMDYQVSSQTYYLLPQSFTATVVQIIQYESHRIFYHSPFFI